MRIEGSGQQDLPAGQAPTMRRAVICDVDEKARSTVESILGDEGIEVVGQLANSRDLPEMTGERRPDVVILGVASDADIQAIAEVAALHIAPVVVLAADPAGEHIAGVRDAGALAYLAKPTSRAALIPAVEVAIARAAELSRLQADVLAARRRLESRKTIDRAKGLLMTHRRMSEPEAFRWIQRTAMDRRKTSVAVAAQVVAELGDRPARAAS